MRLWLKKFHLTGHYLISKDKFFRDVNSTVCVRDFEKATGMKLKDGEIKEIESIKIKLKK